MEETWVTSLHLENMIGVLRNASIGEVLLSEQLTPGACIDPWIMH